MSEKNKGVYYNYTELIMAVKTKHKNETRHETALRYIKQAEYKNPLDFGKKNE